MSNELRKHPQLGPVLRQLRERAGLKRPEAVAALSARRRSRTGDSDAEYSGDWYARIETRPRSYPSSEDLSDILEIIGSNEEELRKELGLNTDPSEVRIQNAVSRRSIVSPGTDLASGAIHHRAAPQPLMSSSHSFAASPLRSLAGESGSDQLTMVSPLPSIHLEESAPEQQLLESFKKLLPENQERALAHTRSLLARQKN